MNNRKNDTAVEFASAFRAIILYPEHNSFSIDRMFNCMGDDADMRQLVMQYIEGMGGKDSDITNAALILFQLSDVLPYRRDIKDAHQDLIDAIKNKKLTVEYANNLYLLYHNDDRLTQVQGRSFLATRLVSNLKSPEWQETVLKIRDIVEVKLQAEVEKLATAAEKISLLEKSKTLPIFTEHLSNFVVTGAFGRTDSVVRIDAMLDQIKRTQVEGSVLKNSFR